MPAARKPVPVAPAPRTSFLDDPVLCGPPVPLDSITDVRTRLLAATEHLLLEGGMGAVSLRRIASLAGAHPGQVAYYFGNLAGLLAETADANLSLMLDRRQQLFDSAATLPDPLQRLRHLLDAFLQPLLYAAAHGREAPASMVLREVIAGADAAARQPLAHRINTSLDTSARLLADLLPHLDRPRLMLRLRLISGSAVYLAPNVEQVGLFRNTAHTRAALKLAYTELAGMAEVTLQAP